MGVIINEMNTTLRMQGYQWYLNNVQSMRQNLSYFKAAALVMGVSGGAGGGENGTSVYNMLSEILAGYEPVQYGNPEPRPDRKNFKELSMTGFIDHWLNIIAFEMSFDDGKFKLTDYFNFNEGGASGIFVKSGFGEMIVNNISFLAVALISPDMHFDLNSMPPSSETSSWGYTYVLNSEGSRVTIVPAAYESALETQFTKTLFYTSSGSPALFLFANNYGQCNGDNYRLVDGSGSQMSEYISSRMSKKFYYWHCLGSWWRY